MLSGLSIKWKLLIPVLFILFMTITQIYLIVNMNQSQQEDTARVNLAGRQRMLSQKMTKETLTYLITKDPKMAEDQAADIKLLEKSLETLISGGTIDLSGRAVLIKPTENEEILSALKEAKQYWENSRDIFAGALARPDQAVIIEINEASNGFLQRFDRITGMYESASSSMIKRSMMFIYTCMFFYVLVAAAAWHYVQKNFIKPILSLRDTAGKIAAGDLSQ